MIANSTTAVGVISGCAFAGDPFGWYTVAGVALTIAGVCLSSVQDKEKEEPRGEAEATDSAQ